MRNEPQHGQNVTGRRRMRFAGSDSRARLGPRRRSLRLGSATVAGAGPGLRPCPTLDEPAGRRASVILIVDDHPDDLARFLSALRRHPLPAETELIVVANAPGDAVDEASLGAPESTVLLPRPPRMGGRGQPRHGRAGVGASSSSSTPRWSRRRLALPAAGRVGGRTVGMAGGWGVRAGTGARSRGTPGEVDAVEGYCLAVRREALRAGGFDRRFRWYRNADLDLSFAVRAAGWRAVQTDRLALQRHDTAIGSALPDRARPAQPAQLLPFPGPLGRSARPRSSTRIASAAGRLVRAMALQAGAAVGADHGRVPRAGGRMKPSPGSVRREVRSPTRKVIDPGRRPGAWCTGAGGA